VLSIVTNAICGTLWKIAYLENDDRRLQLSQVMFLLTRNIFFVTVEVTLQPKNAVVTKLVPLRDWSIIAPKNTYACFSRWGMWSVVRGFVGWGSFWVAKLFW